MRHIRLHRALLALLKIWFFYSVLLFIFYEKSHNIFNRAHTELLTKNESFGLISPKTLTRITGMNNAVSHLGRKKIVFFCSSTTTFVVIKCNLVIYFMAGLGRRRDAVVLKQKFRRLHGNPNPSTAAYFSIYIKYFTNNEPFQLNRILLFAFPVEK